MAEIYQMPGHLIRRLNQISTAVFAEHMATSGLDLTSVQYAALSTIAEHPQIDQVSLAGAIAYDKVTIGGVIDRLESKGLVTRTVSPQDRRMRLLQVTKAGGLLLDRVRPIVVALQDDILAGLTMTERTTLVHLMEKVAIAGNDRSRAPLRRNASQ